MKNYPLKESKKKSDKPKYCEFTGSVNNQLKSDGSVPKYVICPKCKRRIIPHISTCTGGREDIQFACCIYIRLLKHIRKK